MSETIDTRTLYFFGGLDEQSAFAIIDKLYVLKRSGEFVGPNGKTSYLPIEFIISSYGGDVYESLAIYDVMKNIQLQNCPINTLGIGKIMSAAGLLFIAGTEGYRGIGEHATFMMHPTTVDFSGHVEDALQSMDHFKKIEEKYIGLFMKHTKMTEEKIQYYFKQKNDCFFDAEQCMKYGIADYIF